MSIDNIIIQSIKIKSTVLSIINHKCILYKISKIKENNRNYYKEVRYSYFNLIINYVRTLYNLLYCTTFESINI